MANETLNACLLCGGVRMRKDEDATAYLNLLPEHAVVVCLDCSFRFLNPRPDLQAYGQFYEGEQGSLLDDYPVEDAYYSSEEKGRLANYQEKLTRLQRVVPEGRLLELGSCTGVFLSEARKRGYDVVGVEPAHHNRQTAREQYGLELIGGYIEDVRFPDEHFDVVFSSHVFEHLLDPLAVASQIARWLKPGGVHMIEVPNQFRNNTYLKQRYLRRLSPIRRSLLSIHHPVFFSQRTLRLLVERSGLRPLQVRNAFSPGEATRNVRSLLAYFTRQAFKSHSFIEVLAQKPCATC